MMIYVAYDSSIILNPKITITQHLYERKKCLMHIVQSRWCTFISYYFPKKTSVCNDQLINGLYENMSVVYLSQYFHSPRAFTLTQYTRPVTRAHYRIMLLLSFFCVHSSTHMDDALERYEDQMKKLQGKQIFASPSMVDFKKFQRF